MDIDPRWLSLSFRGPDSISPASPLGRALTLSCSLGERWSCAFEPRFPPTTIKSVPPRLPRPSSPFPRLAQASAQGGQRGHPKVDNKALKSSDT